MNVTTIIAEKKVNADKIKKSYWVLLKYKPIWLVVINNNEIVKQLSEGLKNIQAAFIIYNKEGNQAKINENIVVTWKIDETIVSWFDFIICDDDIVNIKKYLEKGIAPIILKESHISSLLKEFNPIKNEWNAYFYDELNSWSIFYSLVRYLENYKFSFDNKNLVNNILKV